MEDADGANSTEPPSSTRRIGTRGIVLVVGHCGGATRPGDVSDLRRGNRFPGIAGIRKPACSVEPTTALILPPEDELRPEGVAPQRNRFSTSKVR